MNRPLIPVVVLILSLTACGVSQPVPPRPVDEGQSFMMTEGETIVLRNNKTELNFVEVVEDSRCPIEAECVVAGQVTVRVKLWESNNSQTLDLTLSSDDEYVSADGQFVTVLLYAVEPYPSVENDPNAPTVGTFVLLGPECCAAP